MTMSPEDQLYSLLLYSYGHSDHITRNQAEQGLDGEKYNLVLASMLKTFGHGAPAWGFIGTTLGLLVPLIMKMLVGTPNRFIPGLLS